MKAACCRKFCLGNFEGTTVVRDLKASGKVGLFDFRENATRERERVGRNMWVPLAYVGFSHPFTRETHRVQPVFFGGFASTTFFGTPAAIDFREAPTDAAQAGRGRFSWRGISPAPPVATLKKPCDRSLKGYPVNNHLGCVI